MKRWIPALWLLGACSGSQLSGEVDGTPAAGLRSAIFDKIEVGAFGFTLEATVVMMSDIPDACQVVEELVEVRTSDCVDTCEDLGDVGNDYLGKDEYWWTIVVLNPYDDDTGTYAFDAGFEDEGDFTASFSALDVSEIYDADNCEDECQAGDELLQNDDEQASGGTVTLDTFENNVEATGELELDFPGDEALKGRFKAEHCNLEAFIEGAIF